VNVKLNTEVVLESVRKYEREQEKAGKDLEDRILIIFGTSAVVKYISYLDRIKCLSCVERSLAAK